MKFISALVFLAATAYAQSNSTSTNSTAPPAVEDPAIKCLHTCNESDVACRAKCVGVPNPTDKMANSTVECVSHCNQNDTAAFTKCRESCINQNFMADRPAPVPSPDGKNSSGNSSDGNSTETSGSYGNGQHIGFLGFAGAVVLVNAL